MTSAKDSLERHRAAVRARLLGSDHMRAGPGSITWKINREVIVVAGWGRAILLQLAHPAVAAGVHDHSSFRGSIRSSFRRLHSTIGAMLSLTFGDTEQMIAAAAGINTIHDRVRGHIGDGSGQPYSAHDPDLQRWVHATLLESIPLTYELLVRTARRVRERDQYCREAAIVEPLLGMPAGSLPRDSAQLDAYMREMLTGGTHRRDRHQPGARTSSVISAAVVRGLARLPGDAAAHDRFAAAIDPPRVRLRLACA